MNFLSNLDNQKKVDLIIFCVPEEAMATYVHEMRLYFPAGMYPLTNWTAERGAAFISSSLLAKAATVAAESSTSSEEALVMATPKSRMFHWLLQKQRAKNQSGKIILMLPQQSLLHHLIC